MYQFLKLRSFSLFACLALAEIVGAAAAVYGDRSVVQIPGLQLHPLGQSLVDQADGGLKI